MEIREKEFTVRFDASEGRLTFTGSLRLMTREYREIQDLLDQVLRAPPKQLEVDVQALQMINSSGLNTLSRFILGLRQKPEVKVRLHGARNIVWQAKTLGNMKHFLPTAELLFH